MFVYDNIASSKHSRCRDRSGGGSSIGGLLAFLGLVVAKENKTSEFRQAWIDALRGDLSKLIARANAIRGVMAVGFKDKEALYKALEAHFVEINQVTTGIRLRLNQDETACKPILAGINRLEKLMIEADSIDIAACRACEKEILAHARTFLKREWKRVRRGETTFFITKWFGLAAIVAGIVWLVWTATQAPVEVLQRLYSP